MLLLLALACAGPPKPDAPSVSGSAPDPDDTADTDDRIPPEVDPTFDLDLARGSCDSLIAPWSAATAEEILAASQVVMPDRHQLFDGLLYFIAAARSPEDGGCPTVTRVEDGDTTTSTYTGNCTGADGREYTGSIVYETVDVGESQLGAFHADEARVRIEDDEGTYHAALDGTYVQGEDGTYTFDLVWGSVGTGIYEQARTYGALVLAEGDIVDGEDQVGSTHVGYVRRDDDFLSGDLCLDQETWYAGDTCDEPPTGTTTLVGAATATVTWDGATACDGCAAVTYDGADLGMACRE